MVFSNLKKFVSFVNRWGGEIALYQENLRVNQIELRLVITCSFLVTICKCLCYPIWHFMVFLLNGKKIL